MDYVLIMFLICMYLHASKSRNVLHEWQWSGCESLDDNNMRNVVFWVDRFEYCLKVVFGDIEVKQTRYLHIAYHVRYMYINTK